MKNYSNKIKLALNIIKKFNSNVNVQRTDDENTVYLFDYSTQKKTVGSAAINKAVEKAVKQQDWPESVVYSEGMLFCQSAEVKAVQTEIIETVETVETTEPELFAESETETETEPKKRGRKKKSEE
jgi:hypothetical protein